MNWLKKYGFKIASWTIFLLSLWFLYRRFFVLKHGFEFQNLEKDFSSVHWLFGMIALLLVIVNWGIEAYKWKFVTRILEPLNFKTALKSILMGVAVSSVFPNRTGEFLGKILVLEKRNKVKGIFASMIAGLSQLFITLLAGTLALIFYHQSMLNPLKISSGIYFWSVLLLVLSLSLYLLLPRIALVMELIIPAKWIQYIAFCKNYSFKDLIILNLLSLLRYMVFALQLYLLFLFFGKIMDMALFAQLAAISFLLTTIIPTMALSELFVRSNVGLMIFSITGTADEIIVAIYTLLWIINIALPALIGFYFGLKWKT